MFDWIARELGLVAGRIDETVRRWVGDLINGLYGFLHVIFQTVQAGWNRLNRAITNFDETFYLFVHAVWNKFYGLIRVAIPAIINEYRRLIHDLTASVAFIYRTLLAGLDAVRNYALRLVTDAVRWVETNIYDPLFRFISQAWNWITERGETIWEYITHPDKLAELLFGHLIDLLEREAWTVADRLGKFFLSLVIRNAKQFAALVEDILDAIL